MEKLLNFEVSAGNDEKNNNVKVNQSRNKRKVLITNVIKSYCCFGCAVFVFLSLILTIIFEYIDKRKLNTMILNLNNEIEVLNKEIKQYKTDSDMLMNENIQLKNEILKFQRDEKDYKNVIEELKQKIISSDTTSSIKPNEYVKYSTPLQSIIIRTNKEYEFVLNIIPTKHKLKLLYRATRDGDTHDVFLSMVGKAMNTLSIVETEFGDKIGGVVHKDWACIKKEVIIRIDKEAFIFSVDKEKVYSINSDAFAIECNDKSLIKFGEDISIYEKCLSKANGSSEFPSNYYGGDNYELTNGKAVFKVNELEVFEIIPDDN